jgi:hypothetical protein
MGRIGYILSLSRLTSLKEIQKKRYSTIMKRIIGNFAFWVCIKMMSVAAIHLVLDAFSLSPLSKIKIV